MPSGISDTNNYCKAFQSSSKLVKYARNTDKIPIMIKHANIIRHLQKQWFNGYKI